MSAPFNVDTTDLRDIASALEAFTRVTKETGVRLDAYGPVDLRHTDSDTTFKVTWGGDDESGKYVIQDRIGE